MSVRMIRRYGLGLLLLGSIFAWTLAAEGFVTREEGLAAAFPGARIQSETLFLTPNQQKDISALSGVDIPTPMIARYIASSDSGILGRAYVDTHVVRTKKESLLIMLDADGILLRIETTASTEDPEYRADKSWYQQYEGKRLDDDLYINRAIRPLAGATLTARAANQAVRRILAIDKILSSQQENR